jgi:hypothetical protein
MEIRFRCSVGADRKFVFFERLTNDTGRPAESFFSAPGRSIQIVALVFGGSHIAYTELLGCIDTIFLNEYLRKVWDFSAAYCVANSVLNTGSRRKHHFGCVRL